MVVAGAGLGPRELRVVGPNLIADGRTVIAELDVITAEQLPVRVTALEGKNTYQTACSNTTHFAGDVETTGAVKIDVPSSAIIGSAIRIDGALQTGGTLVDIEGTPGQQAVNVNVGDVRIADDASVDGSISAGGTLTMAGIVQDTAVDVYGSLIQDASVPVESMSLIDGVAQEVIDVNMTVGTLTVSSLDSGNITSNASDMKYTISIPGVYKVDMSINTQTDTDNLSLDIFMCKNGAPTGFISSSMKLKDRISTQALQGIIPLIAGDTIAMCVRSNGGNMAVEIHNANICITRLRTNA
jgi:hypothetical protein